jgi:hypothetical protein
MTNTRSQKLWIIKVISFIFFSILTVTGLINWLALPKGYGPSGGLLFL